MNSIVCSLLLIFCFSYLNGQDIERVRILSKEVKILNLLNGIEFSKEQKESIKKSIKKIEDIEKDFEREMVEYVELFEVGLEKSIEILGDGKELPPSLTKNISTYNHTLIEMIREKEEKIFEVAGEVMNVLEPQQVYQLENFIPCLIPPPGKTRVGQADNPEMIVKHLERIRNIPDDIYMINQEYLIDRIIKKEKEHSSILADFDEDVERVRLEQLLNKVRNTSDVDFALNKENLAEELKGKDHKRNSGNEVLLKIRGFLLDPIVLKYI